LLRYRGAAMAEFWRALRTLKALQAEQAFEADAELAASPSRRAPRPPLVCRSQPNEPDRAEPRLAYLPSEPPASSDLHEPAAAWPPNEPETRPAPQVSARVAAGSSAGRHLPTGAQDGRRELPRSGDQDASPARAIRV
jgi:hypothetical protein